MAKYPYPSTSKLKRDHITYQCKGSVAGVGGGAGRQGMVLGGGREAGHGVGIWHFSKICRQIPCPQANRSIQMHKNFLELISFIRVATVREKPGKNENFSRSGKCLVDPSVHWTKKDSNIPSPEEQDHSNAPPQVQHKIKSPPLPTPCPALLFAIYFSEAAWLTETVGMTWSERLLMELISF